MAIRFPAELPYDASDYLLEVYAAVVAGDWAEAKRRYDADPQPVMDAAGAIRWWRERFTPAAVVIVAAPGTSPQAFTYQPGVVYAFALPRDGRPGMSVSSGAIPCYGGIGEPGTLTAWAMGATPPMQGLAGQHFSMRIDGDQPQAGRYSLE